MDYNINSIIEYLQIIKELQKDDRIMIYRGQADSEWDLVPSLYRDNYYIGKEKDILADIRKHNYPEFAEQDLFINELVKMQHYGIPTILLDWTRNPLNALFFAVSGEPEKDGHIIVKQTDKIMKFNNDCYKSFSKLLKSIYKDDFTSNYFDEMAEKLILKMLYNSYNQIFIDPIFENQRIRVQDGLFSVSVLFNHKIYDKLESNLIYYILNNGLKKKIFSIYDHEHQGRIIESKFRDFISDDKILQYYYFYDQRESQNVINSLEGYLKIVNGGYDDLVSILEKFYEEINRKLDKVKQGLLLSSSEGKYYKKDNIIKALKDENSKDFHQIFIPIGKKDPILKELNELYGINSATIYPDVEGYIQYLKAKFS